MGDRSGQGLAPGAEGRHDEVVQSADQTADQQGLGALAAALAADQDLGGRGRLGEGILPVHVLDEVFPEGNEEQDAEHAAEQRGKEHLPEVHLQAQDIDGGQGEDGARYDYARTGADGLDDHILPQTAFLAEGGGESDGEDSDRDGRFEDLADLEAEIGRCGGEDDGHQKAYRDGIGGDFRVGFFRFEQGLVTLARLEGAAGVFRQGDVLVLVHCILYFCVNIYKIWLPGALEWEKTKKLKKDLQVQKKSLSLQPVLKKAVVH